jgi:Leucine-rich repeat (LRR) protein
MFWPNLTELDLRGNRITDAGAKHLLAAPVPPDLTALLLGGNPISDDMRTKLRRHFGPAVLFDE